MQSIARIKRQADATAYADVRSRIKDCDILLYRGRSWESRLIRLVTGAPYSHAGLALWWRDRLMVLEAVSRGVVVTPLSRNVRRYDGRVEWFSCSEPLSDATRAHMAEYAQKELGKDYSTWDTILLGLRRFFRTAGAGTDRPTRRRKLFCSLYVAAVYNAAGLDLKRGTSDRFTAPGDLASSPLLRRVAVLHRG